MKSSVASIPRVQQREACNSVGCVGIKTIGDGDNRREREHHCVPKLPPTQRQVVDGLTIYCSGIWDRLAGVHVEKSLTQAEQSELRYAFFCLHQCVVMSQVLRSPVNKFSPCWNTFDCVRVYSHRLQSDTH